jgi:hypothetical protein
VVGCDWKYGGGHWFNAVNDGGTVKAIDGQGGSVEPWPPSAQNLGFDESDIRFLYCGREGQRQMITRERAERIAGEITPLLYSVCHSNALASAVMPLNLPLSQMLF